MNVTSTSHRFPLAAAALALTATSAALAAAAWLVVPLAFGEVARLGLMLAAAFGVVWITGVIALGAVAILGPMGPMPTIYAFFAGMMLRMVLTMGSAMLLFHQGLVAGRPLAVCLAFAYLPALAVEAAFVARFLWQMDPRTNPRNNPRNKPGNNPGNSAPNDSSLVPPPQVMA